MRLTDLLKQESIVILDGAKRLPRAGMLVNNKEPGLFSRFTCNQLGGIAIRETVFNSHIAESLLGHVVMGMADRSHRDAIYGARGMALNAHVPHEVPALTVARICGSGAQAIVSGVQLLLLEDHDPEKPFIVVGGAESMQYPHILYRLRGKKVGEQTVKYGPVDVHTLPKGSFAQDAMLMALFDPHAGMAMANTAEELGRRYGITREEADWLAFQSHRKAKEARDSGWFDEEIVNISFNGDGKVIKCSCDTHIRDDISMEGLRRLPPAFEPPDGIITAGNASGVVDGAGAMIICKENVAEAHGCKVLARIVSWGVAGVDPKIMGIGPVPATKIALMRAGLEHWQIDTVELNEAFAPQALACMNEFRNNGIDPEKVNPYGGAIALGHPLGATGAILTITAAYRLRREKKRYALITMCIGGGQGIALIIENPNFQK